MRKLRRCIAIAAVLTCALVVVPGLTASAQSDAKPTASDVGVTADEIRIGVVADVDNPFAPGIFKGAHDAVTGAAKFINANGGIAGRKLVVDLYDSKLNANETRNAFIEACEKDFALVGTTALFVTSIDDMVNCKDSQDVATGIPDIAGLTTSLTEGCSPITYSTALINVICSTLKEDPPTAQSMQGPFNYLHDKYKDLHGVFLFSTDTPDARRSGFGQRDSMVAAGIELDDQVGLSSRDPQSAFTPVVQKMKTAGSNISYLTMSLNSAIQLRQEAALQGVPSDDVIWLCPTPCYDRAKMAATGATMDGEQVILPHLPFEEAKQNKMVANFVKYTGKNNVGGPAAVWAWASTIAFRDVLEKIAEDEGVNGITRANVLTGFKALKAFNAEGMIGTLNVGDKIASPCYVLMDWSDGKYTRVHPTKKTTFDCKKSNIRNGPVVSG